MLLSLSEAEQVGLLWQAFEMDLINSEPKGTEQSSNITYYSYLKRSGAGAQASLLHNCVWRCYMWRGCQTPDTWESLLQQTESQCVVASFWSEVMMHLQWTGDTDFIIVMCSPLGLVVLVAGWCSHFLSSIVRLYMFLHSLFGWSSFAHWLSPSGRCCLLSPPGCDAGCIFCRTNISLLSFSVASVLSEYFPLSIYNFMEHFPHNLYHSGFCPLLICVLFDWWNVYFVANNQYWLFIVLDCGWSLPNKEIAVMSFAPWWLLTCLL